MFKKYPRLFAHVAATENGNYVLPDCIINKNDEGIVNKFHRHCPHRMYPLHESGEIIQDVWCKFHNFKWDKNGTPINNTKKLHCGNLEVGRSGIIFENFVEPNHKWIDDLAKEKNLVYSHCFQGTSEGSWLWLMDAEADLLHIYQEGIHPFLSKQIKLDDVGMDQGEGWILQTHPDGWWMYLFPFSFIEYGEPGCVMVNTVVPNDINTEYGFKWISQFYYDPSVGPNERMIFETLENVFREDVATAEKQKGDYFPLMKAFNKWEDHCVWFGDWVRKNRIKDK